jgi:hypothetical protein
METKVCRKCGKELPTSEFFTSKKAKDGLHSYCKSCCMEAAKESQRRRKEKKKKGEMAEFEKKHKIYTNIELAKFTPRELMLELKARGYEGELLYVEHIVKDHRINLGKLD